MSEAARSLFAAIREVCNAATWSRGIELSRADAVVGERGDDDEVVLHVSTRGGMVCPRVTLFPQDADWECECSSRERACEHVAAAVIAWRKSAEQGDDLPAPRRSGGRVGYRFRRMDGKLALERVIVDRGAARPLTATLAAVAAGRVQGPRFLARKEDLTIEVALGTHRSGPLGRALVARVLPLMAQATEVQLDGSPVTVSADPVLPRVLLEDAGDGFRLRLVPDPSVTERFGDGVALCGETLRPIGDPRLTAREREQLDRGQYFDSENVATLLTETLPGLRSRVPVDVQTERLPGTEVEPPRLALEVDRDGHTLSVLATLVYGDPPRARVDSGRLVHLGGTVPLRDTSAERVLMRQLSRAGLTPGVRARFEGIEAVSFRSGLAGLEAAVQGDALDHFRLAAPLDPALRLDGGELDIQFRSTSGRADPGAVLRAWRAGESLVPLLGGGWAPLPADWLTRYGERIADLLAARDEAGGRIPPCLGAEVAELSDELGLEGPVDPGPLRRLAAGFEGIPRVELPADLTARLRHYQQDGVDWLVLLREANLGALLADDMGLGKTLQTLCALRPPALVVAPTSVLHNWAHEIETHRPGLTHQVFHGARRNLDEADVTLTTYTILRLDTERLASRRWSTIVLDEAQNIKNPDSQVARAAYRLEAPFKIALTGTPVENRLEELWSQLNFVNRGLLGGRRDFQRRYADPITGGDEQAAARLRRRTRPFILRRLKRDVATELPPRTDMVLNCVLDEEERHTYDSVRAATYGEVTRKLSEGGNVMAALEALLRLRQAACHRALVPGQSAEDSSKLRLLREALESIVAEGHKALVFSQWTSLLDLIEPQLERDGVGFVRLDGATRDRRAVVERFQEDPAVSVMVVSLKAGGVGLNLTAADHIFLLDPWWNPAVEDQAADRAHRIGQLRPVMVYRLVAVDTVEERILALQDRKRQLAEAVLGEAGAPASLTRDDLLDLLA